MHVYKKYINYIITILIALLMNVYTVHGINTYVPKISFSFYFEDGSEILETDYYNNRFEINKIDRFIRHNLREIKSGASHFEIVSHIRECEKEDILSLNRAFILASVVRAHIKVRYGLTNENFTFYVSADEDAFDMVTVDYKPYSVKAIDNQDLFYSQKASYNQIVLMMLKYRNIPFKKTSDTHKKSVSIEYETVKVEQNDNLIQYEEEGHSNLNKVEADVKKDTISKQLNLKPDQSLNTATANSAQQPTVPVSVTVSPSPYNSSDTVIHIEDKLTNTQEHLEKASPITTMENSYKPIIGLTSNPLKLFGVIPSGKGRALPNIAAEFYYSKRFSTKVEGVMTPLTGNAENEEFWWKVSSLF